MDVFIQAITDITIQVPLPLQILFVAIWSAIPLIESDVGVFIAIGVGVPIIPALLAAIAGNIATIWLVIFGADKLRTFLRRGHPPVATVLASTKKQRVKKAISTYGVPGASLLGPLLIGTHLNSIAMIALGVEKKRLFFWQVIAIIVWALIFGGIAWMARGAILGGAA